MVSHDYTFTYLKQLSDVHMWCKMLIMFLMKVVFNKLWSKQHFTFNYILYTIVIKLFFKNTYI